MKQPFLPVLLLLIVWIIVSCGSAVEEGAPRSETLPPHELLLNALIHLPASLNGYQTPETFNNCNAATPVQCFENTNDKTIGTLESIRCHIGQGYYSACRLVQLLRDVHSYSGNNCNSLDVPAKVGEITSIYQTGISDHIYSCVLKLYGSPPYTSPMSLSFRHHITNENNIIADVAADRNLLGSAYPQKVRLFVDNTNFLTGTSMTLSITGISRDNRNTGKPVRMNLKFRRIFLDNTNFYAFLNANYGNVNVNSNFDTTRTLIEFAGTTFHPQFQMNINSYQQNCNFNFNHSGCNAITTYFQGYYSSADNMSYLKLALPNVTISNVNDIYNSNGFLREMRTTLLDESRIEMETACSLFNVESDTMDNLNSCLVLVWNGTSTSQQNLIRPTYNLYANNSNPPPYSEFAVFDSSGHMTMIPSDSTFDILNNMNLTGSDLMNINSGFLYISDRINANTRTLAPMIPSNLGDMVIDIDVTH